MIERSSTRSTLAIMIVTLLLCPTVAFSGFVLNERVWLDRIPQGIYGYYTGEDIRTQATARYFGTPDDPWALIETLSYSSQHNWVQGLEDNYISFPNPTTGQIIRCTKNDINAQGFRCGAHQVVSVRTCPFSYTVQGRAQAYTSPDHEFAGWMYAAPSYTICNDPPGNCLSLRNRVPSETKVVRLSGAPGTNLSSVSPFGLSTIEDAAGGSFIREEWAILRLDNGGGYIEATSSSVFGHQKLQQLAAGESSSGRFLVVERPVHFRNEQWIPVPLLEVIDARGGPALDSAVADTTTSDYRGGPLESALAIIRAEFDDGVIVDIESLDNPDLSEQMLRRIRRQLILRYRNQDLHRAIAYAHIRIDFGMRVVILRSVVVLPQCCCSPGDVFCTDPYP